MWWQCQQIAEIDERKAVRFHARNFKLRVLKTWVGVIASEKEAAKKNSILAERHNVLWVVCQTSAYFFITSVEFYERY